ncbi:hypothetical protein FRX31_025132, partial [Thalictrum thalictroides]
GTERTNTDSGAFDFGVPDQSIRLHVEDIVGFSIGDETIQHMLLHYAFTQNVWFSSYLNFKIVHYQNLNVATWIESWFSVPQLWLLSREKWSIHCITTTWEIWKIRCSKIFKNTYLKAPQLAALIDKKVSRLLEEAKVNEDSDVITRSAQTLSGFYL